jgi:acetyltransferase-like isoleucine patch superfamily enzyme
MHPTIKEIGKRVLGFGLPDWCGLAIIYRLIYRGYFTSWLGAQWLRKVFWAEPMLRAISTSVGKRLRLEHLPFVQGHGNIIIDNNVNISGKIDIGFNSSLGLSPTLRIGSHTFIGHGCGFSIAKGVRIGEHCLIAGHVLFFDNDGHPLEAVTRRNNAPVAKESVAAIVVGNDVWIGMGSYVLKGVQIGDRSIVGAASVVTKSVPPDTIVAGNPAKVIGNLKPETGNR